MPTDTELHKAAHQGDLGKVKELVESGEIEVNAPGAAERRALHRAAGGNHVAVITYLLEKGAPHEQADKSGRTALHWACISGHKEATELLLTKDPNLAATTVSGTSGLMSACEGGRVELVRILLEKAGSHEKITELCTMKDNDSKSPWDLALAGQHKAVCKLLKEQGDPNAASAACVIC